jgi:uncharacterized membrane protein
MWRVIFKITLIAKTLDIAAACIYCYLLKGTMLMRIIENNDAQMRYTIPSEFLSFDC